jgi:hypothetical protein
VRGRAVPTRKEVEDSAIAFRQQYAPGQIGTVKMEQILDGMGVDIVPIPHLCRKHGSKGFVCASGKVICVDRAILLNQPAEYLGHLTHETAHIKQHPELIPSKFTSVEEFKEFHRNLSRELVSCLEWEAREWTGRVLVPRGQLEAVFEAAVQNHHQAYVDAFGAQTAHNIFGGLVVDIVADRFGVLPSIAQMRIHADGLWIRLAKITRDAVREEKSHVG